VFFSAGDPVLESGELVGEGEVLVEEGGDLGVHGLELSLQVFDGTFGCQTLFVQLLFESV